MLVCNPQTLAICRGEKEGALRVTVALEEKARMYLETKLSAQWERELGMCPHTRALVRPSVKDALSRLMLPRLVRHARKDLLHAGHRAAIKSFAANVRIRPKPGEGRGEEGFFIGARVEVFFVGLL